MAESSIDDNSSDAPLQSLIADFLDAEGRGELIDREAWLAQHAIHAESLRDFLANHDRMKKSAPIAPDEVTSPPQCHTHNEATEMPAAFGVAFLPFPWFTLAWSLKRRWWQLNWLLVVAIVFGGTYGFLGYWTEAKKLHPLEHLEWTWDAVTWISIVGMLMAGWLAVALRASQSLIRRMWRWEFRSHLVR